LIATASSTCFGVAAVAPSTPRRSLRVTQSTSSKMAFTWISGGSAERLNAGASRSPNSPRRDNACQQLMGSLRRGR
jgi:hypothetical protein